jgi:hypothetical protein
VVLSVVLRVAVGVDVTEGVTDVDELLTAFVGDAEGVFVWVVVDDCVAEIVSDLVCVHLGVVVRVKEWLLLLPILVKLLEADSETGTEYDVERAAVSEALNVNVVRVALSLPRERVSLFVADCAFDAVSEAEATTLGDSVCDVDAVSTFDTEAVSSLAHIAPP